MTQPAGADMSHRCLMETERINGSQNSENHFSDFDWKPILLWEQSPHLRESNESCRIPENCFSAFLYLSSKRAVCTCFVPAVKPSHASVCTDWSLLNSILVPFWISLFENRMNEKKRNSPKLQKRVLVFFTENKLTLQLLQLIFQLLPLPTYTLQLFPSTDSATAFISYTAGNSTILKVCSDRKWRKCFCLLPFL